MAVELALDDLVRRARDEIALGRVELAEVVVGECGRLLHDAEGLDDGAPEAVAADLEVLQAALGLGAPVLVGADLDGAHAVGFDAYAHGWDALIGFRFGGGRRALTAHVGGMGERSRGGVGERPGGLRGARRRNGQREREDASLVDAALDLDLAPLELKEPLGDGEPEPGPVARRPARVGHVVEDAGQPIGRARARPVSDTATRAAPPPSSAEARMTMRPSGFVEL